eukprot:m.169217 g.169217  ORF g.169217 m.169217 type:complete len:110 (-) comp31557_c0_seq1:92-421(-)
MESTQAQAIQSNRTLEISSSSRARIFHVAQMCKEEANEYLSRYDAFSSSTIQSGSCSMQRELQKTSESNIGGSTQDQNNDNPGYGFVCVSHSPSPSPSSVYLLLVLVLI